jgi:hypothetical protein
VLLEAQKNRGNFGDPIGPDRVGALHAFVTLSRVMAFSVPFREDDTAEEHALKTRVKQRILETSEAVEDLLEYPSVTRAAAYFVGKNFLSKLYPLSQWVGEGFDERIEHLRDQLDPPLQIPLNNSHNPTLDLSNLTSPENNNPRQQVPEWLKEATANIPSQIADKLKEINPTTES